MASTTLVRRLCCTLRPSTAFEGPGARRAFSTAPQLLLQPTFKQQASFGPGSDRDPLAVEEKNWEFDDITQIAHSDLEQHREARKYARIAVYEMPKLAHFAKPFELPTPKQVLRFRYTTYMGESHPAESKVVMEFSTLDLGLSDVSRRKLIKICGPRYNPALDLMKFSCDMFDTQAQNKRYLSDLLDRLIEEANDLTDDFEDIPFDFRHYEKKHTVKPKFPVEWRMPKARRLQRRAEREAQLAGQTQTAA